LIFFWLKQILLDIYIFLLNHGLISNSRMVKSVDTLETLELINSDMVQG